MLGQLPNPPGVIKEIHKLSPGSVLWQCNSAHEVDRKSTRLNSSHTVIYTLSLHDALPISWLKNKNLPTPSFSTCPYFSLFDLIWSQANAEASSFECSVSCLIPLALSRKYTNSPLAPFFGNAIRLTK